MIKKNKIDLNTWKRKAHFEFYKNYEQAFFNITANVDVTNLYQFCKKNNYSFFLTCLYISTKTANSIEEFKTRLENDDAFIYDTINSGSTILKEDNTFFFCYLEFFPDLEMFLANSRKQINIQKKISFNDGNRDNQAVIYHSTLPWISFTSVQHAQDKEKGNSVPKIVFGKYFNSGEQLLMPLSVEVHHAFADGYHVGLFFDKFQKEIDHLSL